LQDTAARRADPEITVPVLEKAHHAGQSARGWIVRIERDRPDRVRAAIEKGQAGARCVSNPEESMAVFEKRYSNAVRQWDVQENMSARPIEFIQAIRGAHPELALAIFSGPPDVVGAERVRIVLIMIEMGQRAGLRIHPMQASARG